MLTARFLEKEFGAHKNLDVIAFNPGLTGDTSLMGKQPTILKLLLASRPLFFLISLFRLAFFIDSETLGETLAEVTPGKVLFPAGIICFQQAYLIA